MGEPEACRRCYFWEKMAVDHGACRRFPPTTIVFNGEKESPLPQTTGDWWCGEFKIRVSPE